MLVSLMLHTGTFVALSLMLITGHMLMFSTFPTSTMLGVLTCLNTLKKNNLAKSNHQKIQKKSKKKYKYSVTLINIKNNISCSFPKGVERSIVVIWSFPILNHPTKILIQLSVNCPRLRKLYLLMRIVRYSLTLSLECFVHVDILNIITLWK